MVVGDVAVVPGGRELPSRRYGNYLETASFAEAVVLLGDKPRALRPGRSPFPRMFLMFVRLPPNCTASTRRRETGPEGPSSAGEYPRWRRRWKHAGLSRATAAVGQVDRPDEALGTVLGEDHHHGDDRLHRRALVRQSRRRRLSRRRCARAPQRRLRSKRLPTGCTVSARCRSVASKADDVKPVAALRSERQGRRRSAA
jgi:hypothetical protein